MNPLNIFILTLTFFCTIAFSQQKPKTNLEVFEELITAGLEKYLYYPDLHREYQFVFVVDQPESGNSVNKVSSRVKFLTSIIKKTSGNNNLHYSFASNLNNIQSDSVYNLVVLHIKNLETRYPGFKKNKFLGDKTLTRNILINIAIDIKSSDNKFTLSDFIKSNYSDEVNLDDYENLESQQYEFTKAEPPQIGAFESIVFPLVLVSSTAAATLLFFIIRSK